MTEAEIQECILAHEARNSALHELLIDKGVDLDEVRLIECHFWTWSEEDAQDLARELQNLGFTILRSDSAVSSQDPSLWNLEAAIQQSASRALAPEFTENMVRLGAVHNGKYDGWGTSV